MGTDVEIKPELARVARGIQAVMSRRTSYVGASTENVDIGLFQPGLRSADAEVIRDAKMLRGRARDLVRNNPIAMQAVRISRISTIGVVFKLALQPAWQALGIKREDATAWARYIEGEWHRYANGLDHWADAGRRMTFVEQMRLVHDTEYVDGESLLVAEWDEQRHWSTSFQLVDVDRLKNRDHRPDTQFLKAGVELDRFGAPVSYHILNRHPSDHGIAIEPDTWSVVPRETTWGRPVVMHSYDVRRPGQTRGVSEFAPVIRALAMGQRYADTELANAVVQASYAAVLTSSMDYKEAAEAIGGAFEQAGASDEITQVALDSLAATAEYYESAEVKFDGVKIPKLWPGDKLEFVSAGHPSQQYTDFQKFNIRSIAAGTGSDPSALSQDYSDVNYSSARAAAAANWRTIEERRARIVSRTAMKCVAAWFEEGVAKGRLPLPRGVPVSAFYEVRDKLIAGTFRTAGRPMVDPVKERQAQERGLAMGVTTLEEIAASEGKDWEESLEQQKREQDMRERLGLFPPMPGAPLPPPSDANDVADEADGGKPE